MWNAKWLIGVAALSGVAWKAWSAPQVWGLVLDVLFALAMAWSLFVAVFFLTASHLRRSPTDAARERSERARSARHAGALAMRTHR